MLSFLKNLFSQAPSGGASGTTFSSARQTLSPAPDVIYAIGDIHGCYDHLRQLEELVLEDAASIDGSKLMIILGDFVDRGPNSARVIDHLLAPPPEGFDRICLTGNHERMMLQYLHNPKSAAAWLDFGGRETLFSYGITPWSLDSATSSARKLQQLLQSHIPQEHIRFLHQLPVMVQTETHIFVHAGLRPGVPLSEQSDEDMLMIKSDFLDSSHDFEFMVVHGHSVVSQPQNLPNRINTDTGAYATGRLTAVRLTSNGEPQFLQTRADVNSEKLSL